MNEKESTDLPPCPGELSGNLRHAVEQVRSEPYSQTVLERALQRARHLETPATVAGDEQQESPQSRGFLRMAGPFDSRRRQLIMTRLAALVLAAIGITGLMSWFPFSGSAVAFAQVQVAIDKVQSVTYDATTQLPRQPQQNSRVLVLGSNRIRVELPDNEYAVLVTHDNQVDTLVVKPRQKRAIQITGRPPRESSPADLYQRLRTIRAKAVKELPDRNIDGKQALGFLAEDPQQSMRVWIDANTNLPLYIETTRHQTDGNDILETASNFVFDSKLDEALFSTEAPTGYTVQTQTYPPANDSVESLKPELLVMTPQLGLGPAHFGMSKQEIIEVLGQPDDTQTSDLGETLRYDSKGFWIGLGSDGKMRSITGHAHAAHAAPVARTFAGQTSAGIAMGASRRDIATTYGPPNSEEDFASKFGNVRTMFYWDEGLSFSLKDDALTEIHLSVPKTTN